MTKKYKLVDEFLESEFAMTKQEVIEYGQYLRGQMDIESFEESFEVNDIETALSVLESANIYSVDVDEFRKFYEKEYKNEIGGNDDDMKCSWDMFLDSHSYEEFCEYNSMIDTIDMWITNMQND